MSDGADRATIEDGRALLGVELGSTRIKACLIDGGGRVLAAGGHDWENRLVDGHWTYPLEDVRDGLRAAYRDLAEDAGRRHGATVGSLAGIGVSAMMHGHLAFAADGELLVPFRTWRDTTTGPAAEALTERLGVNIPMRWSVAHLLQAVLDGEPHVGRIASITTLAGLAHRWLTGRDVLGVGDASGVFPIDPATRGFDEGLLERFQGLVADRAPGLVLRDLLPEVLPAGTPAGRLTAESAALLDPSGTLRPGATACPPEGDAGTGMVATGSVAPRQANVSVGTSVFAMVVLEGPLAHVHPEIDPVATPTGEPVAMVHCNNGASELAAWTGLFARFAEAAGTPMAADAVYRVLLDEAMAADPSADGVLAYNLLSGEPVLGLEAGRPLVVRTPDGALSLGALMRAQLHAVFGALALGVRILGDEGVRLDRVLAHGGLLRTEGAAERVLAAALDAPIEVGATAAEGGAWGIAVLAAYVLQGDGVPLGRWLDEGVLAGAKTRRADPDPAEVAAFGAFLERYRAGVAVERAAVDAL